MTFNELVVIGEPADIERVKLLLLLFLVCLFFFPCFGETKLCVVTVRA
jgi:hypothetical protein